ncbi:MAG TPA: hypothetical protein VEC17_03575 [Candidatus Binatia bacterium]|nr:hypothetical protein [Candidatus Binatia bacterium]
MKNNTDTAPANGPQESWWMQPVRNEPAPTGPIVHPAAHLEHIVQEEIEKHEGKVA